MGSPPKTHFRKSSQETYCGRSTKKVVSSFFNLGIDCSDCKKEFANFAAKEKYKTKVKKKKYIYEPGYDKDLEKEDNIPESRDCLTCTKSFEPKGRFNFICHSCVKSAEFIDAEEYRLIV